MIPRETASFFLDTDEINGILGGSIEAIFRTKPVAKPFDVIHIDGRAFHIVSVTALPLSEVSKMFHSRCGFGTPEEFSETFVSTEEDVTDSTTIYTHRIAECDCSNCASTSCDRNGLCKQWSGWSAL